MSIRTIVYDFGTFVMFSIFESVILVFSKHSNFRGVLKSFTKKSCKSTNQEHLKNCEDSRKQRMKIQEASEDLQLGEILFPNPDARYLKTLHIRITMRSACAVSHQRDRPKYVSNVPTTSSLV